MWKRLLTTYMLAILVCFGCNENPVSPHNGIGPILFVSTRDAKRQIYAMNKDGSNITRITRSDFSNFNPRWSPDGQYLLVDNWKGTSISAPTRLVVHIDLINLIDSTRTELTESPPQLTSSGRFSPDGQWIVYVHKDSSNTAIRNIYIMNRDGSGKRNVTNSDTLSALNPAWSPDGSKILFINWEGLDQSGVPKYNIYSINIDGTGLIPLTEESDQVEAAGLDWKW